MPPSFDVVTHVVHCHHAAACDVYCAHVSALVFELWLKIHLAQVGVVGSGQGMTDYKKVARHDFNPDAD